MVPPIKKISIKSMKLIYNNIRALVSVYATLRGLWSAMPYNVTASTGESLHPPYQPKGINV